MGSTATSREPDTFRRATPPSGSLAQTSQPVGAGSLIASIFFQSARYDANLNTRIPSHASINVNSLFYLLAFILPMALLYYIERQES